MKIRCSDCKKRFDYDMYSGVCPKCGNYMRPSEIETSENESCEVEGSHVHTESMEPAKKKKKSNPAITILLTVLMITTFLVTIIVVYVGQKNIHESKTVQEAIVPTVCQAEDGFTYTADYNRYDISIDSVTVDDDPEFDLPEEYEAILITYSIERTYLNNGGSDYDSFYEIRMTPYLETLSGYYLEPVSEYELRKIKGIDDYEQADEMGLGSRFEHKEGKLYYYVKKDDIKGLYITSMDYDYENYESGALREIIRVEGLEVTR